MRVMFRIASPQHYSPSKIWCTRIRNPSREQGQWKSKGHFSVYSEIPGGDVICCILRRLSLKVPFDEGPRSMYSNQLKWCTPSKLIERAQYCPYLRLKSTDHQLSIWCHYNAWTPAFRWWRVLGTAERELTNKTLDNKMKKSNASETILSEPC